MTWSLAGLVVATAAVWLSLRDRTSPLERCSPALTAALALSLALGLSSLLAFWWAVVAGGLDSWFTVTDASVWTLAAGIALVRLRRRSVAGPVPPSGARPFSRSASVGRAAFLLVATIAAAAAVATYRTVPYGHPDATLIWNLKALFMLRGDDQWTDFIGVSRSNPSHPFLVSASVARLWQYEGEASTLVPAVLGMATAAAIAAALIGALDARRTRAWIAGCVVIAPPAFSRLAVGQTADLACGLYLLTAVIMLFAYGDAARLPQRRRLLLAGLLAGLMAWTKNEGLIFLAAATAITLAATFRSSGFRATAWLMAGAAPVLVAVAWVKGVLAPVAPEYLAGSEAGSSLLFRVLDVERHAALLQTAWHHAWQWGGPMAAGSLPIVVVAALAIALARAEPSARYVVALLVIMIASYYAVWLMSPLDPVWLVGETFERLFMQLWPSFVLVAFAHGAEVMTTVGREAR